MKSARKLRAVPNCPQPETPVKPMKYGAAPWSRLPPSPPAHEISIRARAQSLLTRDGKRPEVPDYETALRIIAAANRPKRCTVPQPLCRPAQKNAPTPVECAQAGFPLPSGVSCDREHEHTAGRQSIHSSPCGCTDDAQRHYALIARDLIAAGRDDELTDDMRQAYDYEFGGVPEPEPPQIPEF